MLKRTLNDAAHGALREIAHRRVEAMDARQVAEEIHRAAPVLGRVYTLGTGPEAQRKRIHDRVDAMSPAELRDAASGRLPGAVQSLLAWLDR